jgi:hypothetical protein
VCINLKNFNPINASTVDVSINKRLNVGKKLADGPTGESGDRAPFRGRLVFTSTNLVAEHTFAVTCGPRK